MAAHTAILIPVFVLAAWTACVLLRVAFVRVTGPMRPHAYTLGEPDGVPARVAIPNRNYMNLLELPLLFYVACLLLFVTGGATPLAVALAWAYVALRIAHSLIHLSYNHVMHRFTAFALSNFVLIILWWCAWQGVRALAQ
ncbi:MAG: MAPEG family protein [Pseudomonadota bacterium]